MLVKMRKLGLEYTNKALDLNIEKPFEDPVLNLLLPRDSIRLQSLFLKATFQHLSGMHEQSEQTCTTFINMHEHNRHYT